MLPTTVVRLEAAALSLPLTEPFAIATGTQTRADNVLVRVTLRDGTTGLGEAAPTTHVSGETVARTLATVTAVRDAIVGEDCRSWRRLARVLRQAAGDEPAACCAVEVALLDALLCHARVPMWSFFGGSTTELATDMTITAGDAAHAARSARDIVGRGIASIKVKIAAGSVDEDLARLAAIHAAAPGARLTVDANAAWDLDRARAFLAGLAARGIPLALFEQPLPVGEHAAWRELRRGGVPLCADESARSAHDVLALVAEKAVDVVNIKAMKTGVVESLAIASIARAAGLGLMIGGMVESILAMSFSAAFAAGLGGFAFVDLDTPMFIPKHPFAGGFAQQGERLSLAHVEAGHGVTLAPTAADPFAAVCA